MKMRIHHNLHVLSVFAFKIPQCPYLGTAKLRTSTTNGHLSFRCNGVNSALCAHVSTLMCRYFECGFMPTASNLHNAYSCVILAGYMVALRYCLTSRTTLPGDVSEWRHVMQRCCDMAQHFIEVALNILGGKIHDSDGT